MKYANDDERSSRLEKIGLAVTGITAGAFALKNSGNMKYLSKAIEDIGSTIGKVSEDLSTKAFKDLDYTALKGVVKNNILDETSTWRSVRNDNGFDLDYSRGLLSSVLQYNKIKGTGTGLSDEMFDAVQKNHVITKLVDNMGEQSGEFFGELTKLVDESLNQKNTFFESNTQGTSIIKTEFDNRLAGSILEPHKEQIINVMEQAINEASNLELDFRQQYNDGLKDKLSNTFKEEIINKYSDKKDFFKDTLDRAATVNDLLQNMENETVKINNNKLFEGTHDNIFDTLSSLVQEDERFGNLVIDNATLRVNKNGELYSTKAINDLKYNVKEEAADTLFGKLFGLRSIVDNQKSPDFFYFAQGSYDSILGKLTGSENGILRTDHFKLGDKIFQYKNNELSHVSDADNLYLMSGQHGSFNVLTNRIQGNFNKKVQNNKTLKYFDFNTTGVNVVEEAKGFFGKMKKDSSWVEHIPNRLFNKDTYLTIDEKTASQFHSDIKSINKLYNHRTFAPSKRTISELRKALGPEANKVLASLDSDNAVNYLIDNNYSKFANQDLTSLVNKYKRNISATHTMAQIGNLGGKNGMNILKFDDLLKREIIKEALLKDSASENKFTSSFIQGYSISHSKLSKLDITGADRKNLNNLFNWSIFQTETSSFSSSMHQIADSKKRINMMSRFGSIINGASRNDQTNAFFSNFRKGVNSFIKSSASWRDVVLEEDNSIQKGYKNNQWVTMRKAISPLDIIKNINDETKLNSTSKGFVKQFYAGRNNTNDITTATLLPYHMLNRLITPMENFGLGFSADNTGSVGALAKNLGLKRILPAMALAYGFSYANFEAENFTGNSFTQDYYNFRANFGLGVKTASSVFGLTERHRRSRMYNPVANYYLGEYKDRDEYLDYLENGYDPVRKGRWWSFGSASEFRGGKISYWEPNQLRQAYSHYKDVSLYGSTDEKWKHSLIPTPRHPLSTLRFLMNPYWLEEKHYWDRPYPVTAPLFEEETPWGAILNPTIGQLIKPVRRMHSAELQGTLLDVRSIIANRNEDIRNKSADTRIVRVDQSGFTPMDYHPNSMPSLNEAIYTIKFNGNKVASAGFDGEEYSSDMANVSHTFVPVVKGRSNGSNVIQYTNVSNASSFMSNMLLSGLTSLVTHGVSSANTSLGLIGGINSSIKGRAFDSNEFQSKGVINENAKLQNMPFTIAANNAKDKYLNSLNINDIGTKSDYVSDLIYSGKQLSGMYGFLFDSILPTKHGYQLENAGQMNSFVRSFWDNDLGGWGGDFMEIARRFFPHENHDIDQINPLRNTMPLWLPGRFQTGDPYTKVTKGEARLPGAGYETLNRLHPDKYGRYGAFDRYKILADVSPGSDEYKTWKKITKAEYGNNPAIKKEMDAIEKRVKAQSTNHQFYNYQFLGKDMKTKHAIIDTVNNNGSFTVVGSKEQYSLAGVKPLKDPDKQSYVHEFLKSGMMVSLEYENNNYRNRNSAGSISAIVKFGSENISQKMWQEKKAKEKDNQETLADSLFAASDSNKFWGPFWEMIGHAQVPYLHNKYLRIDSPMESYKKEQIYGTNWSTWDHPLKGFVYPAFTTGWGKGIGIQALGLASWYWSNQAREKGIEGIAKYASHAAFAFTNPYALVGGVIGALPRMNWGSNASRFGWNSKNGANIAATIGIVGYGFAHLNNPFLSAVNFGAAGFAVAKQLKVPATEFPTLSKMLNIAEKEGDSISGGKGAVFGAAIGVTLSALKNPEFSLNKLTDKYIPGRTKKKWEMEEYFDRLEYIKYMNLYHQAARLAERKDGVDIARIINKFQYNENKNDKLLTKLQAQRDKVQKYVFNQEVKDKLTATIDAQVYKLQVPEQYYSMGKYTKAALAYKKAADTTIYGLTKYSSPADVLRALPSYDRDYFLEFAKEKDPKARKKILKYVSPYKQKALHVLWGDKIDKQESNKNFFSNHNLPNMFWSGWRPDINLDNIKMKTIENEGMLLSDFGYYDSAKNEPAYQQAPTINNIHSSPSPLALQRDMLSLLHGVGLHSVDVSVEPSSASGLQVVANIGRVTQYNLQQKVQNVLYKLF